MKMLLRNPTPAAEREEEARALIERICGVRSTSSPSRNRRASAARGRKILNDHDAGQVLLQPRRNLPRLVAASLVDGAIRLLNTRSMN